MQVIVEFVFGVIVTLIYSKILVWFESRARKSPHIRRNSNRDYVVEDESGKVL